MTKVGFYYPEMSGNSVRGIGFYANNLFRCIQDNYSERIKIEMFNDIGLAHNYNLVHFPYFDLFDNSLPFFRKYKTIVTVHDTIPLIYPEIYKKGLLTRTKLIAQMLAIKSVNSIITDSYDSVRQIKKYLNVADEKINLIYLAASDIYTKHISDTQILKVRDKYSLPEKFVLYTGDINYNKNLPLLINSCIDSKVNLVLVGKNAKEVPNLDLNHSELSHLKSVKKYFIENKIITPGFVSNDDLAAIYQAASIYCQPSFSEGFGIPVLEAMSAGCPVLLSNSALSLQEIAGGSAEYFNSNSQDDLVSKIQLLMNDPLKRKKMSEAGKIQSKLFSWKKTAENTIEVYESLL